MLATDDSTILAVQDIYLHTLIIIVLSHQIDMWQATTLLVRVLVPATESLRVGSQARLRRSYAVQYSYSRLHRQYTHGLFQTLTATPQPHGYQTLDDLQCCWDPDV